MSNKCCLLLGFLWLYTLTPSNSFANQQTDDIVDRIQKQYHSITSFSGHFIQINYLSESPKTPRKATGMIAYTRPGKMRWTYEKPEEQLLVTDGQTVWLYDPLLENVTIQPLKQVTQDTAMSFLLGIGNLKAEFTQKPVSRPLFQGDNIELIELRPLKPLANIAFIQLAINPKTYNLKAIILMDTLENYRSIEFTQMSYNLDLDQKLFTFQVTPEMEIINAEKE
ncbi:outer membrane lipoprotein chaperone LolA [Deltaproteobacteria bacterium TL4]